MAGTLPPDSGDGKGHGVPDEVWVRVLRTFDGWDPGSIVLVPRSRLRGLVTTGEAESLPELSNVDRAALFAQKVREAIQESRGPGVQSSDRLYGSQDIVDELNRRLDVKVSVKHGIRWLQKRGARFEPSDRPGARTMLRMSEFERLGLRRRD